MQIKVQKSSKYQNEEIKYFYDIIIKYNSINGLKEGWEVLMNEKGKKNYNEHKNNKYTKIGVIGSENKGKNTILSDLAIFRSSNWSINKN